MRIHLVDGTYELFRSHFGAPPRKSPDGREVGATLGLLRSLLMLVSTPGVTHAACAFDHVVESFRNDLFPGYKTSAGVDADLLAQFSLAERAVAALGLVVWPLVEFEADGFPGIPGWGAKSASAVLSRYDHLEAIPDDPGQLRLPLARASRLVESLAAHREEAFLYRRLATLRDDVPIEEELADLEWRGAKAELQEVCRELGDEGLLKRVTAWRG